MRIKQIVLAAACVLMAAGSAAAAEQKAPIDTIFAQGAINPYRKFRKAPAFMPRI